MTTETFNFADFTSTSKIWTATDAQLWSAVRATTKAGATVDAEELPFKAYIRRPGGSRRARAYRWILTNAKIQLSINEGLSATV